MIITKNTIGSASPVIYSIQTTAFQKSFSLYALPFQSRERQKERGEGGRGGERVREGGRKGRKGGRESINFFVQISINVTLELSSL